MKTLEEIIDNSRRIVFFGGAGVSTESGIPDFRSTDGLYYMQYDFPPEEILSHHFFEERPGEFFRFYREKMICYDAKPNAAHLRLAEWEKEGKLSAIVTQNIDGLHQMAGSRKVLELHGSIHRNHCVKCGRFYDLSAVSSPALTDTEGIPRCSCGGIIKPDVVLYEEALDEHVLQEAVEEICLADTLIIGGTSLNVYPAAGLIRYFNGPNMVLINRERTSADERAALCIHDSIGKVLGSL